MVDIKPNTLMQNTMNLIAWRSNDNLVRIGVHRQVQFPPDAALFLTVLFHLPFAFTEDF